MEAHLGRRLEPWELVHHKDGNKSNNALDNLELTEFGPHTVLHHTGKPHSAEARRRLEAFAQMRWELERVRAVNADLLAALEGVVKWVGTDATYMDNATANLVNAALTKARGSAPLGGSE